jgi:hypothetical protein
MAFTGFHEIVKIDMIADMATKGVEIRRRDAKVRIELERH